MNKKLRTILQYIFFLGLGIFLTWFSLKGLNKENITQIKASLQNARYWLIAPVFVILFLSHYIRGLRWRLLIEPLGYRPSKANTVAAVFIGYMANQAFPRLGEVLKCTVLARYEKIPADKLIGTIILERLIDAITLLIIFGITLAVQPHLYSQIMTTFFYRAEQEAKQEEGIPLWLLAVALIVVIALGIGIWMFIKKKTVSDVFQLFKKVWLSVLQGISSIRKLKKRGQFILLTIALWTAYLSGGYLGFMALQETSHYGIKEAFTVLSAGSVGMIIPAPGGIGTYAYMIQMTMQLYGLDSIISIAFGWLLWLAQTTVILIGGLISFVALPYLNKNKLQREQSRSNTE